MRKKEPTQLDYAILGLLKGAPMTGYAIRKIFETSAMGNYSSSPGAIYPALKRLQQLALVKKIDTKTGFQLTSEGKEKLINWLQQPISQEDISKRMDTLLLRFAFMEGIVPLNPQIEFLSQFIKQLTIVEMGLSGYYQINELTLPINGQLAIENGLEVYRAHLRWAKMARKRLLQLNDK